MDSDFIKQAILALIRTAAAPLITWLSLKLDIAPDVTTAFIVGAVTAGVMYIWSLFNKSRYETKIDTALTLPADSSRSKLKDVMES